MITISYDALHIIYLVGVFVGIMLVFIASEDYEYTDEDDDI